jgi:SPP1 family predicted phage head-tail adaptor
MIAAGEIKKQIQLQAPTITRASDGSEIFAWITLATIGADIASGGGREFWQAKQVNAEISHIVRLRYRSKISPRYRIIYGDRILQILAIIDPDESKTELKLMCKEVVR